MNLNREELTALVEYFKILADIDARKNKDV
jgi:hypothetical protein